MAKAKKSGYVVRPADVPIIKGMILRGDRKHDICAWFGLNPARVAEVEKGEHGAQPAAPQSKLLPSGSPGPRAQILRTEAQKVLHSLRKQTSTDTTAAMQRLEDALAKFDTDE